MGLNAVVGMVGTPLLNDVLARDPDMLVINVTDATPAFLSEAYGWAIPQEAFTAEGFLAKRAKAVVYSSPEMVARAAADLELAHLETVVAPFGINFEELPETCPQKSVTGRLNLLFIGLDWERKGGDVAVETLNRLRAGH